MNLLVDLPKDEWAARLFVSHSKFDFHRHRRAPTGAWQGVCRTVNTRLHKIYVLYVHEHVPATSIMISKQIYKHLNVFSIISDELMLPHCWRSARHSILEHLESGWTANIAWIAFVFSVYSSQCMDFPNWPLPGAVIGFREPSPIPNWQRLFWQYLNCHIFKHFFRKLIVLNPSIPNINLIDHYRQKATPPTTNTFWSRVKILFLRSSHENNRKI